MRLKKVFAGALAAAMLVCAVAVPAFAAEEVEQENCLTSSYVQMNIPYADFYKAAGVDNASEIDAVTSATRNKPRAGKLVAGSYHVNADGTDIPPFHQFGGGERSSEAAGSAAVLRQIIPSRITFCTPAGKPCFSLHCLHSVHRERFFHTFFRRTAGG